MTDFVRVQDARTGAKFTVARDGVDTENQTILDAVDAVDYAGNPLPPEPASDHAPDVDAGGDDATVARFVRVKDSRTGAHLTVAVDGVDPEFHTVLADHDPLGPDGRPLPPKPLVSASGVVVDQDSDDDQGPSWGEHTVAELKAEIDSRNIARADDQQIEVAEPGNKAELIAALQADDDAQA